METGRSERRSFFKMIPAIVCAVIILAFICVDMHGVLDREAGIQYKGIGKMEYTEPGETWNGTVPVYEIEPGGIDIYGDHDGELNIHVTLTYHVTGEVYYDADVTEKNVTSDALNNSVIRLNAADGPSGKKIYKRGDYDIRIANRSESDEFGFEILTDAKEPNTLNIGMYRHTDIGIYILIAVIILSTLMMIILFTCSGSVEIHKLFLYLVILMGGIYFISTSPINMVDSRAHIHAAYRFSNIFLGKGDNWTARTSDAAVMNAIPYQNITNIEDILRFTGHDIKLAGSGASALINTENKMKFYSLWNYIPQTLGLILGRLLGLSSWLTFQLGRLFTFITFVICSYNAVKKTPHYKMIFAMFLLSPCAIVASVSYSYDVMVIICCANLIACIMRLYAEEAEKKALSLKDIFADSAFTETIFWAFLLGAVKGGGYALILPIALILIKKGDVGSYLKTGLIMAAGIISVLIFDVIVPHGEKLFQLGTAGSENLTTSYAFLHPIRYMGMWIVSLIEQFDIWLLGPVSARFSGSDNELLPAVLLALIVVTALMQKDRLSLPTVKKALIIIICVVTAYYIPAMVLLETKEGSRYINLSQGRYFFPIELIISLFLPGSGSVLWKKTVSETSGSTENNGSGSENISADKITDNLDIRLFRAYVIIAMIYMYLCLRWYLV